MTPPKSQWQVLILIIFDMLLALLPSQITCGKWVAYEVQRTLAEVRLFSLLIEHFSCAFNNLFPEQIPQPVNISGEAERENWDEGANGRKTKKEGGGDPSIWGGASCNYPMTSAERKEEYLRSIHHLNSFHSLKLELLTHMLAWILDAGGELFVFFLESVCGSGLALPLLRWEGPADVIECSKLSLKEALCWQL